MQGERESPTGVIFDIQRYSIHDGPGIRTLVFFKGCPLRCVWCSNPESQKGVPEILYSRSRCENCGRCMDACPVNAIGDFEDGRTIDRSLCDLCGDCIEVCPQEALELAGRAMTVDEVVREVEKDRAFYRNSGGGVTLSGGESLRQPAFCAALLEACRALGIHTALETCGFCSREDLRSILPYVELVLYDLKCMDPILHHRSTGVRNEIILDNAGYLAKSNIPVVFRLPIVPGYTDSPAHLKAAAEFIVALAAAGQVELLPYHRLGEPKYRKLGLHYPLAGLSPPSTEKMQELAAVVASYGLEVHIGG